jgi:GT2 family glycosyltransferase
MAGAAPTVAVVIPSWNSAELLPRCLDSLAGEGEVELIVVDNGSTDGTVEHLRERWPAVEVVALAENAGFAAGVNRGLERARGEFVALVNNDIELDPDFLRELEAGLARDPGAASAASKMLRFDDRTVIDATGDTLRWSGVALQRGQGERDEGQYDRPERVFSACAGAALYRRSAFDAVGMFDEAFFAYLEDVDWGFRAQLAGFGCAYVPTAIAYHVGSATTRREGKPDPFFYGLPRRNNVWMVLKNYPASALVRSAPVLLINHAGLVYVAVRDGMARAHWRALRDAARGLPRVLRQRRAIQAGRRVGRRELVSLVTRSSTIAGPRRRISR